MRDSAIALLARREHSRAELQRKLTDRFRGKRRGGEGSEDESDLACGETPYVFDDVLRAALDGLEADGLLSDARCAEMIVHARTSRGQGPRKIRQALRDAGIDCVLADLALEAAEADWAEQLRRVCEQRFGDAPPRDGREWAKRARFLASRGFSEALVRSHLGDLPAR